MFNKQSRSIVKRFGSRLTFTSIVSKVVFTQTPGLLDFLLEHKKLFHTGQLFGVLRFPKGEADVVELEFTAVRADPVS